MNRPNTGHGCICTLSGRDPRCKAEHGGAGNRPPSHPTDPFLYSVIDPALPCGGLPHGYRDDAGFDLVCSERVEVDRFAFARVPTNLRIAPPIGYWALIVGRSSTFVKRHMIVQTAIIDGGYRGPIWCMVYNMLDRYQVVEVGDRVAQVILLPLHTPQVKQVETLPTGDRGENGFGSTGGGA